jgi:transcriptional regulator with XRE-family HTH domain
MSLRRLARLAQTSASQLSRIERGQAGAGDDLIFRLADGLAVSVDDITRGEGVSTTKEKDPAGSVAKAPARADRKKKDVERQVLYPGGAGQRPVPFPGTPEGAVFHYSPEEAARFLPWSALQLKRKAYAREVPFNDGGNRVTFTGLDIREISAMTTVRPLAETVQQRSA